MDASESRLLCFPGLNSSCTRPPKARSEAALLYALLACVSLLTVTLNLLVIVSIAHFRQLHSPTNTLLLSLAVSDLVVGLLVMPVEGLRYTQACWLLGELVCALAPYVSYSLVSASVGNMVLISVDRYVAICDPLLYASKVTPNRAKASVCLCWACSILYNGCILMGHLGQPERYGSCYGECVVVISHVAGTVDLFLSFLGPCTVMVVLYMRVFVVAISQLRVIRSEIFAVNATPSAKRSERKAARTLGIVIAVFLMCFCPYYYPSLAGEDTSTSLSYYALVSWIMLINSCVNPLIYALFYPWFRKAIKLIINLRILQPQSQEYKLL